MAGPVIVIGAGGHARPVIEALTMTGIAVAGLVDRTLDGAPVLGHRVIATLDDLPALLARGITGAVVAIGDNAARLLRGDQARAAGLALPVVVHPTAIVSAHAALGEGTQVMARGFVGPEARLGRLVLVNTAALIEHECEIGDAAHIAPGATVLGNARISAGALIGGGAVVLQGRRVGHASVVGAGAVVTQDVPDGLTVIGAPARPLMR